MWGKKKDSVKETWDMKVKILLQWQRAGGKYSINIEREIRNGDRGSERERGKVKQWEKERIEGLRERKGANLAQRKDAERKEEENLLWRKMKCFLSLASHLVPVLVELIGPGPVAGEVVVCVVGHVDGSGARGDRLHAHLQAVSGQRVRHAEHHVPGIPALQHMRHEWNLLTLYTTRNLCQNVG